MCFVWISEQTAIISLFNINWLVCITEKECVYCAVRTVFMCFVWISEQRAIISLYSINWLVCITEKECVYCAVQTGSLNQLHKPHSVGFLRMTDRPVAETSTWQHKTLTRERRPFRAGIRTRNPSKRAAADPRLIPRGHRDPQNKYIFHLSLIHT
jgi:hypothetical protein